MSDTTKTPDLAESMQWADAVSTLEGYDPGAFELELKRQLIAGQITTDEFVRSMAEYCLAKGS